MNEQEQRIAIAEFEGLQTIYWKAHYTNPGGASSCIFLTEKEANEDFFNDLGVESFTYYNILPDYLNDLNAIHEAENLLTEEQHSIYTLFITAMPGNELPQTGNSASWMLVHATAKRKAEALLRTIEKWKD